jgi:Zn-dependent M28 family amino/carboxypeptidase
MLAAIATGTVGAGLASLLPGGRAVGVGGGLAAAALVADDISNGPRLARRFAAEQKTTWNAVAEIGPTDAERTLVMLSHHDAARTGLLFDPTAQRVVGEAFPGIVERIDTSVPLWWPAVAAPLLVAAGAATRRRKLTALGTFLCAGGAALLHEHATNDVVPGANDNLSGCAVLVAVAEALREQPPEGLRVILASCGAEEVLQGGIYGFCERHLEPLDRERTWVLNLDTIGSPGLILLEGEGTVVMEDYFDRPWRDLIARVAEREGVPIRRGMRSRFSTDAVVPSRMGIPTACIASIDRYKGLSNYHRPSDTPERLNFASLACAADLASAVTRELEVPA